MQHTVEFRAGRGFAAGGRAVTGEGRGPVRGPSADQGRARAPLPPPMLVDLVSPRHRGDSSATGKKPRVRTPPASPRGWRRWGIPVGGGGASGTTVTHPRRKTSSVRRTSLATVGAALSSGRPRRKESAALPMATEQHVMLAAQLLEGCELGTATRLWTVSEAPASPRNRRRGSSDESCSTDCAVDRAVREPRSLSGKLDLELLCAKLDGFGVGARRAS